MKTINNVNPKQNRKITNVCRMAKIGRKIEINTESLWFIISKGAEKNRKYKVSL